ncbi:rhodanese-like domain-containing protein [Tautonia plasticadhaerens]|uniref:Putative adenylyltransferase/sulfurtransferase MoeZ n=1 Tax=Tautonia plasticadhaerens TaxID=2527974 RepID=A0A518H333_9BACT|nr:rhodanese-like domain-containing protein [Tautonia plasticadhaerens]QDV35237.1 putative adenylyltransferase/sulfurtransferase MoeZ [Tautonia plasticadhaerens]
MTQAIDIRRCSPEDLRRRLEAGDPVVVLDVREEEERRFCSIPLPGSATDLHVPIGHVPDLIDELRRVISGRSLFVYCHHGVRSLATARWLAEQGLADVANLEGGIDAWSSSVDPGVPRY